MAITLEQVKKSEEITSYIRRADESLSALGFTEHSFAHVGLVSAQASAILKTLGYDDRTCELAAIAGWLHDIGNVINRIDHAQSGAVMAFRILDKMGASPGETATIITAIGNHDEKTAFPVNPVAAALILADKMDVRANRVREKARAAFDIHDRVNFSVKKHEVTLTEGEICLTLVIDTEICAVIEYFEIFMDRMLLCRRAAAQEHAVHENFKILDDRADLGVNYERQTDLALRQCDLVLFDGEIHAVVDVECGAGLFPHAVGAHVHFIGQNERCRHGVDREGCLFVMVADGGDDGRRLAGAGAHFIEDTEGHDRAGLGMVDAVDDISDIVQPARDGCQLARAVIIAQRLQDRARLRRDQPHMGKAVFRKAQRRQRLVRPADVACDLLALFDLLQRNCHSISLFNYKFKDLLTLFRSASAEVPPAWPACRP